MATRMGKAASITASRYRGDFDSMVLSVPDPTCFVMLQIDGTTLVVNEAEVAAVAPSDGVMVAQGRAPLRLEGVPSRVYCLDRDFEPAPTRKPRKYVVVSTGAQPFGIACDSVRFLRASEVKLWPLPAILDLPTMQASMIVECRGHRYALLSTMNSVVAGARALEACG